MINEQVWWIILYGCAAAIWYLFKPFRFLLFFFFGFWLSVYDFCFPRSRVSGDSSSVQNFFYNRNIICFTHTTIRKYTIHLPAVYWHDTNYIILGICFIISYLLLSTVVVQKNRTRYFGVQQNADNYLTIPFFVVCVFSYELINSTCTAINYNIIMCSWTY